MPTIPSYPVVVNAADLAAFMQFKKDNGQDLTAEPITVRETGELVQVITVGGVDYVCGRQYILPGQMNVALPLTATTADVIVYNLPYDLPVLLETWDITTNDADIAAATKYWTSVLIGHDAGGPLSVSATVDDKLGTNSTDYSQTVSTFSINPLAVGTTRVAINSTKTGAGGDLYLWSTLRVRNILATLT